MHRVSSSVPLLLAATLAWIAGSLAGLAGMPVALASIGGAIVALALIASGRQSTSVALLLIALAALHLGADLRRADQRCRAIAARATQWEATLLAQAAPGSYVRASMHRANDTACALPIAVAVRSGTAGTGARVVISRAEPSGNDRGLLLREARLMQRVAPGPLARWRDHIASSLDRTFGPDAPMVRALLIADTRGLSPELRERYADAGLVHLLSISGLHVAIVGGALLLLLQSARLPANVASVGAVTVTALYVLAIGAPPPAVRSATLFAATTLTRLLQRPVSPWATFALGAMLPLTEPRTVLDLGWQLSVGGYAAIVVAGRLGRRLPESWRGWRRTLAKELVAGALTTAVTAPLVAWHFGRLSLIAPLSNLAAGPVVSLLQPTLFLAMLTPEGPAARFVADAATPMLRAMDAVANIAASTPGAAIVVTPSAWSALLAGSASVALLVAAWRRHWAPPLTVACACVALLAWMPDGARLPSRGAPQMELHMIDVGQGDAIALRSPGGRWVLVDAGRAWTTGDAGRATVIPYLRRLGGPLALFVLTHPHADHIGGAASIVRALKPTELRDAAFVEGSAIYRDLLRTTQTVGTRWQRVRPGERIEIDGVELDFLAPDSAWTVSLRDPNEASTVVRVRYGSVRFLLTGDAEAGEERWLLDRDAGALDVDVLKVGHHGSATSSTADFLDAVTPRLALVSVGAGNTYRHPSAEVMARLVGQGATVLRTDQLGSLVVRTDGTHIEVEAAGVRWPVARALPGLQ